MNDTVRTALVFLTGLGIGAGLAPVCVSGLGIDLKAGNLRPIREAKHPWPMRVICFVEHSMESDSKIRFLLYC
jgi:hypothetical protein